MASLTEHQKDRYTVAFALATAAVSAIVGVFHLITGDTIGALIDGGIVAVLVLGSLVLWRTN